jgi:hypothetical protein
MRRDVPVEHAPSGVRDHDEHEQHLECGGRDGEEIDGGEARSAIASGQQFQLMPECEVLNRGQKVRKATVVGSIQSGDLPVSRSATSSPTAALHIMPTPPSPET